MPDLPGKRGIPRPSPGVRPGSGSGGGKTSREDSRGGLPQAEAFGRSRPDKIPRLCDVSGQLQGTGGQGGRVIRADGFLI